MFLRVVRGADRYFEKRERERKREKKSLSLSIYICLNINYIRALLYIYIYMCPSFFPITPLSLSVAAAGGTRSCIYNISLLSVFLMLFDFVWVHHFCLSPPLDFLCFSPPPPFLPPSPCAGDIFTHKNTHTPFYYILQGYNNI